MNIGILVGSLRKESWNRKVALSLTTLAPNSMNLHVIEIGALPFFNQDLENNPPQEWEQFRKQLKDLDGFLLVTPEYNRSMPAVIKNALDVGSRPYGKNLWNGLPCGVISASIGAIGGFGANQHLRQTFVFLNAPCMQQPEVYLSHVDKLFNEKGTLNEETQTFLKKFIQQYEQWVTVNRKT